MKNGFVRNQKNHIPLLNYLCYLTHSSRALILQGAKNSCQLQNNFFSFVGAYFKMQSMENFFSSFHYNEMIISFDVALNERVSTQIGHETWREIFAHRIYSICEEALESYTNKYYFFHLSDKSQFRVHLHLIIYPYTSTENFSYIDNCYLNRLEIMINDEIIKSIKREVYAFANELEQRCDDGTLHTLQRASTTIEPKFDATALSNDEKLSLLRLSFYQSPDENCTIDELFEFFKTRYLSKRDPDKIYNTIATYLNFRRIIDPHFSLYNDGIDSVVSKIDSISHVNRRLIELFTAPNIEKKMEQSQNYWTQYSPS